MAKQRLRRRRASPQAVALARPSPISLEPVGRLNPLPSPLSSTLRPLPESLPKLLPNPHSVVRRRLVRETTLPATRVAVTTRKRPRSLLGPSGQKIAVRARRNQLRALYETSRPFPAHRTVCDIRADRRNAIFALGIGGKSWGRGGPNMRKARHTPNSRVSCR